MSKGLKGIMSKEKNPNYGKKWWNNSVENKLCKECPGENYILGRVKVNK